MIAVGGWGQGTASFRGLVETTERMTSFANGTVEFLRKYGFDGLDLDWEYPGIGYRGGKPEDKQKFVDLLRVGNWTKDFSFFLNFDPGVSSHLNLDITKTELFQQ